MTMPSSKFKLLGWPFDHPSKKQDRQTKTNPEPTADSRISDATTVTIGNQRSEVVRSGSKGTITGSTVSVDNGTIKPEESKCSCCEKELHHLSTNCVPAGAKMYTCVTCLGNVCKHCKGQCHECGIKERIALDPEKLLATDRIILLECLSTLHYPMMHKFENWEKGYLVKQILTRFQVHDDWKPPHKSAKVATEAVPKPSADVTKNTAGGASKSNTDGATKDPDQAGRKAQEQPQKVVAKVKGSKQVSHSTFYDKPSVVVEMDSGNAKRDNVKGVKDHLPKDDKPPQKQKKETKITKEDLNESGAYQDLKLVVHLSDVVEAGAPMAKCQKLEAQHHHENTARKEVLAAAGEVPSTDKATTKKSTSSKEDTIKGQTGIHGNSADHAEAEQTKPVAATSQDNTSGKLDVGTPELIKKLLLLHVKDDVIERCNSLKDISSMRGIDELNSKEMRTILRKHSIDVKSLTNDQEMRYAVVRLWRYKKEKENEALVTGSSDRISVPEKQLPSSSEKDRKSDKVARSKSIAAIPAAVPTLRSIRTVKDTENLTGSQLSSILRHHNLDPEKYKRRHQMVYAVTCLWKAEHAAESSKPVRKPTRKDGHQPKDDKVQLTKIPSIEDFQTVHELEKLTVEQMRAILHKYSITTGQYNEKHEIYYAVLLLWNDKRKAARNAPAGTGPPSEDIRHQKREYVKKWLLENCENMPNGEIKDAKVREQRSRSASENASTHSQVIYTLMAKGALSTSAGIMEEKFTGSDEQHRRNIETKVPVEVQQSKKVSQPHVMYAEILHGANQKGNTSSIISFSEAIAPKALQEEFAYIDETFSVASMNQGSARILT